MQNQVLELLSARKGHFFLESGHHGNLWLDLESLCYRPNLLQSAAQELADSISPLDVDVVCGPLVEGAFVGLFAALRLNVPFVYSERFARPSEGGLFPAGYRIPATLREGLRGKRVAIINDVINAGSAVRGTFSDLLECGAIVTAIGALLVLGTAASDFAFSKAIPLKSTAFLPNTIWAASECPFCACGEPLEDVEGFAIRLPTRS
jgi:orotate phosphoribosyltransferase